MPPGALGRPGRPAAFAGRDREAARIGLENAFEETWFQLPNG